MTHCSFCYFTTYININIFKKLFLITHSLTELGVELWSNVGKAIDVSTQYSSKIKCAFECHVMKKSRLHARFELRTATNL